MSIVDDLKKEYPQKDYTNIENPKDKIKKYMKFLEDNMEYFIRETLNSDPSKRNWSYDLFKNHGNYEHWKNCKELRLYAPGVLAHWRYDVVGQCRNVKSFFSTKKEYIIGITFPCYVFNISENGKGEHKNFSVVDIMNLKNQLESFLKNPKWGFKKVEIKQLIYEVKIPNHPLSTTFKPVTEKLKELHINIIF